MHRSHQRLTPLFYYFNRLAEASTGQERSELVEAFALCFPDASIEWVEQLFGSDVFASIRPDLHPKIFMLADAAFFGSTLHLESTIRRYEVSGVENLTLMLYCGAKGVGDARYRTGAESTQPNEFSHNLKVCCALLERGVDPTYNFHRPCPWNLVLHNIGRFSKRKAPMEIKEKVPQLRLLQIFAQHAPDIRKCRKSVSRSGNFETVQMLIMKAKCCNRLELAQNCQCKEAQTARALISETRQLLGYSSAGGSTTKNVRVRRRKRSIFESLCRIL